MPPNSIISGNLLTNTNISEVFKDNNLSLSGEMSILNWVALFLFKSSAVSYWNIIEKSNTRKSQFKKENIRNENSASVAGTSHGSKKWSGQTNRIYTVVRHKLDYSI